MNSIKHFLRPIKIHTLRILDTFFLLPAFLYFELAGKNLKLAGRFLISGYCISGGITNDLLTKLNSIIHPSRTLVLKEKILKPISKATLNDITSQLKINGFAFLDQKLPKEFCDILLKFALANPAVLRQTDDNLSPETSAIFQYSNPMAVIYDFDKSDILSNDCVQQLMIDPVLLSIAQLYFECEPIVDQMSLWWSTNFKKNADGEAAQMYHFDMDRIKWLKVFIYITDVGSENGPHFFISNSHRTGGTPRKLLNKGYARLYDSDINNYFSPNQIQEFVAPRGSILIEDTRGLHKGQHVRNGERLILQYQFSNSLFGADIDRVNIFTNDYDLFTLSQKNPRLLSPFSILPKK